MEAEEISWPPMTVILPQKVWETLDANQQMRVMQTIVNLCQQMMVERKQEETNDQPTN